MRGCWSSEHTLHSKNVLLYDPVRQLLVTYGSLIRTKTNSNEVNFKFSLSVALATFQMLHHHCGSGPRRGQHRPRILPLSRKVLLDSVSETLFKGPSLSNVADAFLVAEVTERSFCTLHTVPVAGVPFLLLTLLSADRPHTNTGRGAGVYLGTGLRSRRLLSRTAQ